MGASLLINDQSPSYGQLKKSAFISKFIDKISIIDPLEMEQQGLAFIADCDISRSEEDLVTNYVFKKYNINNGLIIDFPHFVFQSRIDLDKI